MSSSLQIYFQHYIENVRKLKSSTAAHYLDALKNISKRLKEKGLVIEDIYEIRDIAALRMIKEKLLQDADFVALNSRGNSMYSAGLNNYIAFAEGGGFKDITDAELMDIPLPVPKQRQSASSQYVRSDIVRMQAIELAQHRCEIVAGHESFLAKSDKKPYMEGHHVIPLRHQAEFANSLDVYANILCLCPTCHRYLHYGLDLERKQLLDRIYGLRQHRLEASGLDITRKDFISLALS